jgi:histidine triad (HIT) family protein
MSKTIFEKIIDGDIPSYKLYEDENIIIILDAFPKQNGHSLVIPKNTGKINLMEENASITNIIMEKAKETSNLLMLKLGATGIKYISNNFKSAGQEVMQTHLHLIPYYDEEVNIEDISIVYKKMMN